MNILPYRRFVVTSDCTRDQLRERLHDIVSHAFFLFGKNRGGRPFIGRIMKNGFIISLGRSSFFDRLAPPIVTGKFTVDGDRTVIAVAVRLRIVEYMELTLYVFAIVLFSMNLAYSGHPLRNALDSYFSFLEIIAPFGFFAMVLFWMHWFNKWARISGDILISALRNA
jgi:hypothetical protein